MRSAKEWIYQLDLMIEEAQEHLTELYMTDSKSELQEILIQNIQKWEKEKDDIIRSLEKKHRENNK